MKKFLLSSLLGVFLLGFGGITMAITHIDYYTEEGASEPCLTDGYYSATSLLNITDISADTCARPAGKQFAGWKIDGSACEDGWKYYGDEAVRAENNIGYFPAGTKLYCGKGSQHFKAYPQRVDAAYDLWIGRIQVTNENINDILGDGKVFFNPETSTLNVNDAIISDCGTVWVSDDPNYEKKKAAAITTKLGNLVISGDVNINADSNSVYAINDKIDNGGNLTINGNVKINGEMHIKGDLNVISGSITPVITGYNANGKVRSYGSITFSPNVTKIEIPHGIYGASGITLTDPLKIIKPLMGEKTHDSDGYRIGSYSDRVLIQPAEYVDSITIIGINPILGGKATTGGITVNPAEGIQIMTGSCYQCGIRWVVYDGSYSTLNANSTFSTGGDDKYYILYVPYTPKDGYTFKSGYTVSANTGQLTTLNNYQNPSDYYQYNDIVYRVDQIKFMASDIPSASTEISTIIFSGSATVSSGDDLELLEVEDVETPATAGYGYTNHSTVKWVENTWIDVNTTNEPLAVAGTNYGLKVVLTIEDGFQLSATPTLTYNGESWASGHTQFDVANNTVYIDLGTVPASNPTLTTYTLTLYSHSGTGENHVISNITGGDTVMLQAPHQYGLTAIPEGQNSFKGWLIGGTLYTLGSGIVVNESLVGTGQWGGCTSGCGGGGPSSSSSSSSSSSGGGGGGGKTVTKTDTKTDETKAEETQQEGIKSENNENNQELNIPERTQEELKKVLDDGLTQEFHDAYNFGFHYGITTMDSIEKADMNGPLTRIAMAKMLSNYAINVLGKKPANKVVPKFPDVDEKLNEDYGGAVDLAYQLGIMGIGIDKFRPYDPVNRGEFGTSLSRMLFGLADGTDSYYSTHLKELKKRGIISNDNPNLEELRGYVMLMLMRSAMKNN